MRRARCLMIVAGCWLSVSALAVGDEIDPQGLAFFEKNIRPVLVQQCYKCHSAEKIKGGLLLDTRDGIRRGGESGHAVVPGSTDESLILSALRHEDFEMPPGKKLSDEVIANFETWIKMGAPDPRVGKAVAGGKRVIDIEAGRKFWAFQPVRQPSIPDVKNAAWPLAAIDRFVLAAIERAELHPVADAAAGELIRRLYFDLTGLPPSPAEMRQWTERLSSSGTDSVHQAALAELVDRLLSSPQFGERWGRHWLDVVRYADSNGNVDNTPFPHAWRYRNWVIDALNADMPYDRFLTEQLAGDLLPFESPQQQNQQLVATGFLVLGSKPRAQNNPNFQMDVVAEQIDVTTSAMLGLTVGCARCHDHKFDPIPTAEFYSLAGIFGSTRALYGAGVRGNNGNRPVDAGLIELADVDPAAKQARDKFAAELAQVTAKQAEVTKSLARLGVKVENAKGNNKQVANQNRQQIKKLKQQLAKLEQNNGPAKQIRRIKDRLKELGVGDEPNAELVVASADDSAEVQALKSELKSIIDEVQALQAKSPPSPGQAMGARDGNAADCAICLAGESTDRGPVVPRGFVSVVSVQQPPQIPASESGRLQLAEWIASPANPLTARVMVNRVWHHLFGKGIVTSVDNFGELGERPTHPELLDYLAARFVEEKWSVKRLIREVLLTRTYQLSSRHDAASFTKDPDNKWFWRMNPRRLDAEELRDAILAFSGEIDLARPGATEINETGRNQPPVARADGKSRSVYLPVVRNGEPEVFTLFDFADPSIVVGAREETTVPAQSLYLMNNPFVVAQSRVAAQRILKASEEDKIDLAFLHAYGHPATAEQRVQAEDFLRDMQEALGASESDSRRRELAAWSVFCQSLVAAAEFRYLD